MADGDLIDEARKRIGPYSESYKLLDGSGAVDAGKWVDVRTLDNMSLHVFGTFVGTVQLLGSNEATAPATDTNAIQIGANITAPFLSTPGSIPPVRYIKAKVTAWTSGTINAYLHGQAS